MNPKDLSLQQRREVARQTPAGLAWVLSEGQRVCPPHLDLLNRRLLDLVSGRILRLAVFMPPRHGKSELCSRYLPAWFLGTFPDRRIIQAGYGADFAETWGRRARNAMIEANAQGIFSAGVDQTKSAAKEWDILGREGGMYCCGIGSGVTGRGSDLLIVDDPVKSRAEAESRGYREKVWDWYRSDAYTRLSPGGRVLLVVTRWHVDDLAGRLLSGENEDDQVPWTVISLPALAEENDPLGRAPGEALWPERYDADTLRASRATLGSYFFEALYQQRPTKRAGGMFKRDWFQIVGAPLRGAKRVRCWDLAGTEGEGDWTAGVKLAERDGNFCFEDVVRGQWGPRGVRDRVLQTAQLDGPEVEIVLFQDPGQAGKDQVSEYRKLLVGFPVHVMSSSGNPDLRAESLSAQFEAGAVTLLRAHWNEEFIDELCAFSSKSTNGIDDQVDGASGGFVRLTIAGRFGTYFDQLDDDDPEPVEAEADYAQVG